MRNQDAPDELRRRPVGVFDSGVGGLTVLHELLVQLPHEDYVYFADAARFPYGERTPELTISTPRPSIRWSIGRISG